MTGLKQHTIALAIGMSGSLLLASPVAAAGGAWYVGVGGGISNLSPDTASSSFALEEEQSQAASVYLGLDINDWLSAEAAYTDLGEAGLTGDQYIGYTAASVGGIAYVYRNRGIDARQAGLSGYVRLGLNSITNDSGIVLNEADNTAVWIGAGVQYPLGSRFGLRAEVSSFDGDAQVAMASVYWRSKDDVTSGGGFSASAPDPVAPTAPSAQSRADEFDSYDNNNGGFSDPDFEDPFATDSMDSVDPFGTDQNADFNNGFPVASSGQCDAPAAGEPTDAQGCALFSGVVEGVEFGTDSAFLTPDSEYLLQSLAVSMNDHPRLVIELQVHTQDYAEPGRAMQLARERVMGVAQFLAAQGVNVQRLRARAFGSTEPRFNDGSAASSRLNNRVSLRVL